MTTGLAYACLRCRREIPFSAVLTMGVPESGTFFLSHECWCTPAYIFERTFKVDHDAMQRLLGPFRPVLPYNAAPGEPLPLRGHHERRLAIFRWETQHLESVEEFLLFASRPMLPSPPGE